MAPIGKLFGPTINTRNYKPRIVAKYLGIDLDITPEFNVGVDNMTSEYLARVPSGKVPSFVGSDGEFQMFESSAIAYYLASKVGPNSLLGKTPEETGKILQFVLFAETDFSSSAVATILPLIGKIPMVKPTQQAAEEQYHRFLRTLDTILADKTFLVGNRITVADVTVTCALLMSFMFYLTAEDRAKYSSITRYFVNMIGQPEFKSVIGDFKFCKERPSPVPKL